VILRIYEEIDLNVIAYGHTKLLIDQNRDIFSRGSRLSKR